ncbi:lysostaphin resistance A-like protein [Myroides sp. C8-3]|uniref:CPBP family intramembrane glutamic endopeptidase n=1 Tax=Myroides sp. C8-3 TaxID=3400533 RepID=UPI003D2F6599
MKRFLKIENESLIDIGYRLTHKKTFLFILIYFIISFLVFGFTEYTLRGLEINENDLKALSPFFPRNSSQRFLFIFSVLCSAFFEEIIYRGFIITRLVELGINRWIAILPAGVSFVFIHGVIGFSQFTFYFIPAVIFGVIYVLTRRLVFSIIIHLLFNLSAMMAVLSIVK